MGFLAARPTDALESVVGDCTSLGGSLEAAPDDIEVLNSSHR